LAKQKDTTIMHTNIAHLATLLVVADATFIEKWNLQGCPSGGISSRCNNIPPGECCNKGRLVGGSVRIANMPSDVDVAVPYSGRIGGGSNGATRCNSVKLSQVRFGDINCYSNLKLSFGLLIHCSRSIPASMCISQSSVPMKRSDGEADHPGFVDKEEAALPPFTSFKVSCS
jgi:hypothetical protein